MISKGKTESSGLIVEWVLVTDPIGDDVKKETDKFSADLNLSSLLDDRTVSYYSCLKDHYGQNVSVLHFPVFDYQQSNHLADTSTTLTFIFSMASVLIVLNGYSDEGMLDKLNSNRSPHQVMMDLLISMYIEVDNRMDRLGQKIREAKSETIEKANREVLLSLADIEQEMVIFSKRLEDYGEAFHQWLSDSTIDRTCTHQEIEKVRLLIRKSLFNSQLFKELIESTSGLLSDSIDNRLNSIMEFLESIALVISIPTLIFSLFGMNTGGLVGRQSPFGTIVVILISVLLGAAVAIYLKRKKYL
ncbi:CorA family divalent cation transporter [Alkalibacterium pelagium]|uniref:CorA-like Mg2+ transporter protein n=1 Tax=Alkalibacterium pelagium TaxID=426702 RepID=A0A1H7LVR8_9LACT|nr:CorA family divalent cation transporter [Alkalibacterium pelagium]GEN50971.1 hypothetical protein APE02nite_16360 [Alkalibacterium pelagium]SEL02585.1 CorA-like Mg2+ transporter protein [Alkalibacterium pelagium]